MPPGVHILAAPLNHSPLTSAILVLLFLIILLIIILMIILMIPLNINVFLYKSGEQIEGRLMASWLGTSAGSELKGQERLVQGRIWISWLGISLFERASSAPSFIDLISSARERRGGDRQEGKREQNKGQRALEGMRGGQQEEDEGGLSIRQLRSLLAAMPAFVDLIEHLLRSFAFKGIRCRLEFGLDDPARTAVLSGWLWAVAAFLNCLGGDILILPFFEEERLEGELLAQARIRPIHIPVAIVSALRNGEMRTLIKELTGRKR